MPRRLRCASGGFVYHVLNRAVGRATLFDKPGDYHAFEKVLRQARDWLPVPLLACGGPGFDDVAGGGGQQLAVGREVRGDDRVAQP